MKRAALIIAALVVGCGPSQSQTHGSASYVKPASQGGQPCNPQQSQQDLQVTISITGSGTFDRVQSTACTLTSGDLSESTTSSGRINSDGSYVSTFDTQSANSSWTSPLCGAVKNVKLSSITALTVQSSIPSNTQNCQGYCDASAASQCASSVDKTTCTQAASANCKTQCQSSQRITGHGSVQQSDLADTNSKMGSSQGQVDAKADLIFDAVQ